LSGFGLGSFFTVLFPAFRGLRQERHARQAERPLMQGRATRCGLFAARDAAALGVTDRPTSMTQGGTSESRVMTLVTSVTQLPVGHVSAAQKRPENTCGNLP
jgi:hypothetical protein